MNSISVYICVHLRFISFRPYKQSLDHTLVIGRWIKCLEEMEQDLQEPVQEPEGDWGWDVVLAEEEWEVQDPVQALAEYVYALPAVQVSLIKRGLPVTRCPALGVVPEWLEDSRIL